MRNQIEIEAKLKNSPSLNLPIETDNVFEALVNPVNLTSPKNVVVSKRVNAKEPGVNILIIEDDDSIRKLIEGVLRKNGDTVVAISDGEEGISRLFSEHFDLMLSDVRLSGINGLEVAKIVRQRNPDIAIALMTAFPNDELLRNALELDIYDMIVKPFRATSLPLLLKTCIQRHRLIGRPRLEGQNLRVVQSVNLLLSSLQTRERNTAEHSLRVSRFAVAIGVALGLGSNELFLLRHGALIHDVGKQGMPDSVLHKETPLDDAEWKVVRQHPLHGAEILVRDPFLRPLVDIVLSHHERYDGCGYPKGLKGEDIPILARIVSVADAFDVMTSERAYRSSRSIQEAEQQLLEYSGTQFDPKIVQTLLQLPPEQKL